MIIYVDIDETICVTPDDRDYTKASPIQKNINKINELYDNGDTIIYWTARGTGSGIDWREVTENQFKEWGVKYHELKLGKPVYDLFIDDKNKSLSTEAMGALMMCLQKSILEQADIVPMLMDLKFKDVDGELFVLNPPIVKFGLEQVQEEQTTDFSSMRASELKAIAKQQNIRGYSKMKKAELVNALSGRNV
jgi:hypothetical protein